MVKKELNPKILKKLTEKTGKSANAIRIALTRIKNEHNITLNAAAKIYAERFRISINANLSDNDLKILRNKKIEKIPIKIKQKNKRQWDKNRIPKYKYETQDKFLNKHMEEINKTYTYGCYTACFVLCRKFLENLIMHILKMKYPNDKGKYFDIKGNCYLTFGKLLKNLNKSADDFNTEKNLIQRIYEKSLKFKEKTNKMTHSLYHIASKKEIDENDFQETLDLIKDIENKIFR